MLLATAAALAIVAQEPVALRAAPRRSAQVQAQLWPGDALEVRGAQLDHLQVYDHRRERAGYVPAAAVRVVDTDAASAPELLAVARFLRDTPGAEALGIAYVAAHLKAVPAAQLTAEPFALLGALAERIAQRASARTVADGTRVAAQLETVRAYGVAFEGFERDGRMQLCYDGEAFGRVLALPAPPDEQARAALGLTRPECIDPATSPLEVNALHAWRAKVLDRVALEQVPPLLRNRVRLRRAGLWAALAFADTREGRSGREAGERALAELAGVVPAQLPDEDRAAYTEAAVRVGASRWAAEPEITRAKGLRIATTTGGEPGETCVALIDDRHDEKSPLVRRCTYGTVWPASATPNRAGTALTLAVQPLAAWREVWVFHRAPDGWTLKVLPPAAQGPDVGYAEFAGWVPDKPRLLVAREARVDGRWLRSFEIVRLDTLAVVGRADEPGHLSAFHRWQAPAWKALTVSLR